MTIRTLPPVTLSATELPAVLNRLRGVTLPFDMPPALYRDVAADNQLVERGLLVSNGSELALADDAKTLIGLAAHPTAAVWIMQTTGNLSQTYIAIDETGGVAYQATPNGHTFTHLPDVDALAEAVRVALPKNRDTGPRPRVWLAPTAVLGPVLDNSTATPAEYAERVRGLLSCGFSQADITAFVDAVENAEIRGALTGFALGRAGISLTYLVRADTTWTVRLDGESGLSLLRRTNCINLCQQATAIAADIAQRGGFPMPPAP
jgi:hypothetical protein